jgi:hypothetical protein
MRALRADANQPATKHKDSFTAEVIPLLCLQSRALFCRDENNAIKTFPSLHH